MTNPQETPPTPTPTILFVCVHNAGRSQMAEAFATMMITERRLPLRARSAGTDIKSGLNPVVVKAMEEAGISMSGRVPHALTQDMVDQAERIVTMGCGVEAGACPARFLATDDWGLTDAMGKGIERVREVRDEIKRRVEGLLHEMTAAAPAPGA